MSTKYRYRKCPVCQAKARYIEDATIYVQIPHPDPEMILPLTVGCPNTKATICKKCGYLTVDETERPKLKAYADEIIESLKDETKNGDLSTDNPPVIDEQ